MADPNDRATQESEFGLELRTRDRERKLLRKIQVSLVKIDEGTFGYCEETGEEIGLNASRLDQLQHILLKLKREEKLQRNSLKILDSYL